MGFPTTFAEMKEKGYRLDDDAKCRGCRADIEWWYTPTGKKIPMNPMPKNESPAVAHWATCPEAEEFKRKNR